MSSTRKTIKFGFRARVQEPIQRNPILGFRHGGDWDALEFVAIIPFALGKGLEKCTSARSSYGRRHRTRHALIGRTALNSSI
jgi:hypothetical protein